MKGAGLAMSSDTSHTARNDSARATVPVVEIGGTHVTAALVSHGTWRITAGSETRQSVRAHGSAEEILEDIAHAARTLAVPEGSHWAIAIPGPFDYARGVGLYEHVGKFDSLRGIDVRSSLAELISSSPANLHFINDADAYGVGEYAAGAGRGYRRLVCITLGTGVGSAFLLDGEPVNQGPSVPPEGSAHLLNFNGKPLEETVSRRAIRASFAVANGLSGDVPDVHEIAGLARGGDISAARVLRNAFLGLGSAIGKTLTAFDAEALVLGGSMSRSWDVVAPAIRSGLSISGSRFEGMPILAAEHREHSPIIGAAFWASRLSCH